MNPVPVVSAASGAMRLLDYSYNIIKAALKSIESPDGVPADLHEIETAAEDLAESIKQLSVDASQERDKAVMDTCASSCDMAKGFLTVARAFKQSVVGNKQEIVSEALREAGWEQSMEALQARLSRLQLMLRAHVEMETPDRKRDVQVALASMAARVVSVEDKMDHNGVNAKGVTSIADKINETPSNTMTLSWTLETSPSRPPAERNAQMLPEASKRACSKTQVDAFSIQILLIYHKLYLKHERFFHDTDG